MENALSITLMLLIVTIGISYLVAFIITGMVTVLEKMSKKKLSVKETDADGVVEIINDESDIAAVIAIASSQSK